MKEHEQKIIDRLKGFADDVAKGGGKVSKRFPMQGFPRSIDWETAERVYLMYSALYGTGQSLERIAERGGFGWKEVESIAKEYIAVHGTASLTRLTKETPK